MPDSDPFLCPACGWTGNRKETVEFDDAVECPICAELVDRVHEKETTELDPVLCPVCGWTGEQNKVECTDEETQCPVCAENIEFVE